MAKKKNDIADFKSGIDELTRLVDTMEKGNLSLEASLEHFERGIELTKACQTILQQSEQKVSQLIEKNGRQTLIDHDE